MIVLGGAIGVNDSPAYPFLLDEIRLVERRLASGKPLLGSCLGAQIMAAAAGARVYKNTADEVGYLPVTLTGEGKASPLAELAHADFMSPHWHCDAFDLPHGATRLAYSDLTENQAFSFGRNALALQFHIEADPRITGAWLVAYIGDIARAEISVPEFRAAINATAPPPLKRGRGCWRSGWMNWSRRDDGVPVLCYEHPMTINLTNEQISWLKQIASERGYATIDEAAQAVIGDAMAGIPPGFEEPDPVWVVPLLDEARAELERGEGISLEEYQKHLRKRIKELDR